MKKLTGVLATLISAVASIANAQSPSQMPPAPAGQAKQPCTAPEHRQFDFWIGDWDVFTPDGKPAGTNLIKPELGQCVLHEHWVGKGGPVGESFNAYDTSRKLWHQTWVDAGGNVLMLDGRFENGSMVLSDRTLPGKPNPEAVNEIAWTANADGSVRQYWRASRDGGKNWTTLFDGKYVRASRPQPAR